MQKKSDNPGILSLAIPNIITNITVPLLSMVDLHLMGTFQNEVYMGAVAMGNVIFNFVYWGFAFLRMSVSGLAAQAFGASSKAESSATLWRALSIAFIGSFILLLAQTPLIELSLKLMNGTNEVKTLAGNYFTIRIWSAPAIIANMVFFGWFLGMQKPVATMVIAILINIINILLSYVFVYYFKLDIKGVAYSAVIAHYFGLIMCVWVLLKNYNFTFSYFKIYELIKIRAYKSFLNVSGDIFIRTLCVIAVFTFFTSQSAGMGDVVLAANSALLQFLLLFAFFLDGFAYAAEAIIGRLVGAKLNFELSKAVKQLFIWGISLAVAFSLVYWMAFDNMIKLITNRTDILIEAKKYAVWMAIIPLASFMSFIWDGIYIGATASRAMRNTMLFSSILFFFLPFYLLKESLENHAIWLSMVLFFMMRGLSQTWLSKKAIFKN